MDLRVRVGSLLAAALVLLVACASPAPSPSADRNAAPAKETVAVAQPGSQAATAPGKRRLVEFWSTDNEEQRVAAYEKVAAHFMAENAGFDVRIVPLDEATTSQRIATARGANRLPDAARVGVERVAPFLSDGILDVDTATSVIKELGEDSFQQGALDLVRIPDGRYAAVPFDGWVQALWYRSDEFHKLGLAAPIRWDDIRKACEALSGKDGFSYGITLGSDPGQNYGAQVFEQVAMSNDAFPFDKDKNVTMNSPAMVEALTFYTGLQKCAAPGASYWKQAREFYITGQTPMLWYSTYVMDDLVGLQQGVEPSVKGLGDLTGFAANMIGTRGGNATYGQLVVLTIFKGSDVDGISRLIKQMLTGQDYIDILFLAPTGKIPVRKDAVAAWSEHEVFKRYSKETVATVVNGLNTMERWAFAPQMGPVERAVIGDIEGRLYIPQAITNIIDGRMTPQQAADWLQLRFEELYKARLAEKK
jgi:multiple sugar transport system substrate-binding protein